jgi:hypothetical protein
MIAIIQIILFTLYIAYVWHRVGIQKSISESYYTLADEWVFIVFCFTVGILNWFHGNWFAVSGWFLCWVGATAHFKKNNFIKQTHNISAITAITLSLIGIYIYYGIWWLVIPIALTFFVKSNRIWWVEVVAFYVILFTLWRD